MDLQDKSLLCLNCGRQFLFTVRDQQSCARQGFANTPRRCPQCRAARRTARAGQRRGKRTSDMPLEIPRATTTLRQPLSEEGSTPHSRDTKILREMAELSYRCEVLAAEKAELEREKAILLEKVGLLASERDHLKSAFAALSRSAATPENAETSSRRLWWKRVLGARGGLMRRLQTKR